MAKLVLAVLSLLFFLFSVRPALAVTQVLTSVRINPGVMPVMYPSTTKIPLSTLAYDQYGQPIPYGVTYEWGMSSTGSLGILQADTLSSNKIASFDPMYVGTGDLYVIARMGTTMQTASVRVQVVQPGSACAADITVDGIVDISDYSVLATNFFRTTAKATTLRADITGDGLVDLSDYSQLVRSFMQTCQ